MMRHLLRTDTVLVIILSIMFFGGCAKYGKSDLKYKQNEYSKINNEKIVSSPQTQVWDSLVKELSKSFYVINNIDKESRIINVSFFTDLPHDYIDCGKRIRTYTYGAGGKVDKYEYYTAESFNYKVNTVRSAFDDRYLVVERKTHLEGRSNIYIAPDEKNPNKSIITVNTRYIFTLKVNEITYVTGIFGPPSTRSPERIISTSFNTAEIGKLTDDDGIELKCFSKGTLEKIILGMVNDR